MLVPLIETGPCEKCIAGTAGLLASDYCGIIHLILVKPRNCSVTELR